MRITSWLLIAALLLSVAAVYAQDTKVNFSGTWIMNADKSEMGDFGGGRGGRGGRGGGEPRPMVVEMKDNKLIVTTTRPSRDGGDMTSVMTYTLDGKECENEGFRGSTSVSIATWAKDGKMITIQTETNMSFGDRDMTMNSEEVWSLDGENLVVKSVRSTPRGDSESTRVYDKQEEK